VQAGTEVVLERAINGWAWVTAPSGHAGWIPQTCLAAE
jgi:hypothetical protein